MRVRNPSIWCRALPVGGRLGACEPPRLVRLTLLAALALGCVLAGCAGTPGRPASGGAGGTWAGRPIGVRPLPRPALKAAMIGLAEQEWRYFGRQTVVYRGPEESIPHVGLWEDEDAAHSLSRLIELADLPGRYFVPRNVSSYRPKAGDLICASREIPQTRARAGQIPVWALTDAHTHCDLVVRTSGQTLEAIGGNVRNSVSRSLLELDGEGHLQPVPRRPWFLVLEDRL
jgi:hypothetical protein